MALMKYCARERSGGLQIKWLKNRFISFNDSVRLLTPIKHCFRVGNRWFRKGPVDLGGHFLCLECGVQKAISIIILWFLDSLIWFCFEVALNHKKSERRGFKMKEKPGWRYSCYWRIYENNEAELFKKKTWFESLQTTLCGLNKKLFIHFFFIFELFWS